jgi:hypothetical protein
MGAVAEGWIALASEMIRQDGRSSPVTFSRAVNGEYTPGVLGRAEGTPITYSCVAAPLDFKLKEIDQVTILSGQKMLWIPGEDVDGVAVDPQVGDTVDLGTTYRVLEVTSFETESVNCAYLLKIGV